MRENQIYTTTDYDQFVFKAGNREIDPVNASNIAENMKTRGWDGSPIEISINKETGKYQIEEGQHRFVAAKQTSTPVRFIVVKERSVFETAEKNNMQKQWKKMDYIDAYAKEGNYNYKRLKNLAAEFPTISITDIVSAVSGAGSNSCGLKNLKKGYLKVTDEQFYKAREILKDISMMSESLKTIKIKTMYSYIRALIKLLRCGLVDPERMLDKIDKYGRMILPDTASEGQAVERLEMLYNYHQKNGIVYFRDSYKRAMR